MFEHVPYGTCAFECPYQPVNILLAKSSPGWLNKVCYLSKSPLSALYTLEGDFSLLYKRVLHTCEWVLVGSEIRIASLHSCKGFGPKSHIIRVRNSRVWNSRKSQPMEFDCRRRNERYVCIVRLLICYNWVLCDYSISGRTKTMERNISLYFKVIGNVHWSKRKKNFSSDQMGSVAKSYIRKGFLIEEEMRKY